MSEKMTVGRITELTQTPYTPNGKETEAEEQTYPYREALTRTPFTVFCAIRKAWPFHINIALKPELHELRFTPEAVVSAHKDGTLAALVKERLQAAARRLESDELHSQAIEVLTEIYPAK